MSVPLTPNKACCTDQEDNSNEDKNDNESVTGMGDTNANQIYSTNTGKRDEIYIRENKTGTLCTWQSENLTMLNKESRRSGNVGHESPSSEHISDLRLHSPTNKDISKDCMTDDAKDSLTSHGQSPLNSKASLYDRSFQVPISKTYESSINVHSNNVSSERPRIKTSIPSPKTETFIKDHISPTTPVESPLRFLQYADTSHCGIRPTETSSPAEHSFGLSSHNISNTSEEKTIVFYSKPPTSNITGPDYSMDNGTLTHVNRQSTLTYPINVEEPSRLPYKPQVICTIPEAQLYQGQITKQSELTDPKNIQSKSTSPHKLQITLVEVARSKRGDGVFETRRSPLSSPCGQITVSQTNQAGKQTGSLLLTSPSNTKPHDYKVDACYSETKAQISQVSDFQVGHPQEVESSKSKELSYKPTIRKTTSLTDSLDNKIHTSKDRFSVQDYLCQDSDNNFLSSSNATSLKDKNALVDSKKTSLSRKHQSDILKSNLKESHRDPSDFFLCATSPSCPLVNINDQRVASPSSFKDLSVVHADRLSPSSVLPPIESTQLFNISPKATNKTLANSAIPKPILVHSKPFDETEINHNAKTEEIIEPALLVPKPKQVRPKIITYIRRNPQAFDRIPFGQMSMPYGPPSCNVPVPKEHDTLSSDIKPSNVLLDKYKADIHKPRMYSAGLMVSGIRPPGHHSLEETGERQRKDDFCPSTFTHYEVPPSFYRSTMILRPQLGLGAVSRLPSTKSRILIASQRMSGTAIPQQELVTTVGALNNSETPEDLKKGSIPNGAKSNLPKPCQSGLRPPGYSRLPAAKLAAFGFVRSSSVSSLSSNQSNESIQSDHNRATNSNEEHPAPNAAVPSKEIPKGTGRTIPEVCSGTAAPRRSLLPAKKTTTSPAGLKKETQKDQEVIKPAISSPKRQVTKVQSPGHPKLKPTITKNGYAAKTEVQTREPDRQTVQRLKDKCEEQAKELLFIRKEFQKTSCGFLVFAVTTQYFFNKTESGLIKERELSLELATIRNEVAFNTERCEKLQKEKEELEIKFDNEVKKLERHQQEELRGLKERLEQQYDREMEHLQQEQGSQLLQIRSQHQGQIEDMAAKHEAALLEIKTSHSASLSAIHEDHEKRVHKLKEGHELEKKMLEDGFEKLKLSLQDQVDTLTFQNHSLRDRAKMFEEALMKSTNEQLEIALAPYRHLDDDLISIRQVLEMKNQLIHEQEKRIMDLEKLAEINVVLEEKIQVLQQQNEDMRARIDKNVVVTRQLSVENATLQESVEKESKEKKRLSRTNEELVWKLQTAESMSPIKYPSSPVHRSASSGPLSPSKVNSAQR
ncbi:microtubule-associated tumor suppressor candidate 2 isoform X2 [Hyla sarda]|uniref:microtubule-associated tumor suppressor candidate 2 isoform X2 n=1 Tax=Hyla sarda TaxID=327740 RepID=UPI0024C2F067|nr:microtubule-associated tumor suppressor candidate 2 isoform X2 [Hyla sarda]